MYTLRAADFSKAGRAVLGVSCLPGRVHHVVVSWHTRRHSCSSCKDPGCRHVRAALSILGDILGDPSPKEILPACERLMERLVAWGARQVALNASAPGDCGICMATAPLRWGCHRCRMVCCHDCIEQWCQTQPSCPQCRVPVLATTCSIKG